METTAPSYNRVLNRLTNQASNYLNKGDKIPEQLWDKILKFNDFNYKIVNISMKALNIYKKSNANVCNFLSDIHSIEKEMSNLLNDETEGLNAPRNYWKRSKEENHKTITLHSKLSKDNMEKLDKFINLNESKVNKSWWAYF